MTRKPTTMKISDIAPERYCRKGHGPEPMQISWQMNAIHDIHPLCFCFRWLNLLFAQEHMVPNLVLIWDALFAHFSEFVEYACYIAVAHVKMIETLLSEEDYLQTITSLQRATVNDVKQLLSWGSAFWAQDHRPKKPEKRRKFWM
jgi:hypothetical protein